MPSTLSDLERASLGDILFNIDLAFVFAEGLDISGFIADTRTFYAVTRCLEIISEASRRLPPETKGRHPAITWRKVAGSGNIYRYAYEEVTQRALWKHCSRGSARSGPWSKPSFTHQVRIRPDGCAVRAPAAGGTPRASLSASSVVR